MDIQLRRLINSIEGEGFPVRQLWHESHPVTGEGRIRFFTVSDASDGRRPAAHTFVALDYDGDGYGLYVECQSTKITNDVEQICGLEEGTAGLVA